MNTSDNKPQFLVTYSCAACGQESGHPDNETPTCYTCEATEGLTEISRQELTPEVLEARLRQSTENMFSNLLAAYESMSEEDKKNYFAGDTDAEKEMLLLLDKAKKFKDQIRDLNFRKSEDSETQAQ